ncbi:hypothetical protein AAG906_014800 [Vitis piasezkii]
MSALVNDPYLRIMLHRMKAQTPLVSHQRDNATRNPNCRTQCVQGLDHRRLVRRGYLRPRPGRCIPTPHSHPPPRAIPHIKHFISRRLDDILSTPFSSHIINYEPLRGFLVPKFTAYDRSSDPFDHIMHYQQLMTLDIRNNALLCKENESLREFVKRFGQAVLQVKAYSMDVVLQIFKRSICPDTPFFESLAKNLPQLWTTCANKYSMLEDDRSPGCRQGKQSHPKLPPLTPLTVSYEKLLPMIRELSDFRSLHDLVERLIRAGHLKHYIHSEARGGETSRSQASGTLRALIAPRAVINYIHEGPLDEEY